MTRNLLLSLAISATFAGAAIAQEPSVTIAPLSVEGLVVGKSIDVDAGFVEKYGVTAPSPFSFTIPTNEDQNIFFLPAPGGAGIVKVTFATQDERVKSNLQFVHMTIEQGPVEDRLKALESLAFDAFVASVIDPDRANIDVQRYTEVGAYPAVELIGRYDGGDDGVVALRVVAIPDPDSGNGLVAIINALPKNVAMETVEDILRTDASRSLGTLRFR